MAVVVALADDDVERVDDELVMEAEETTLVAVVFDGGDLVVELPLLLEPILWPVLVLAAFEEVDVDVDFAVEAPLPLDPML